MNYYDLMSTEAVFESRSDGQEERNVILNIVLCICIGLMYISNLMLLLK